MKTMLSMPRTISRTVSVRRATHPSAVVGMCVSDQDLVDIIPRVKSVFSDVGEYLVGSEPRPCVYETFLASSVEKIDVAVVSARQSNITAAH